MLLLGHLPKFQPITVTVWAVLYVIADDRVLSVMEHEVWDTDAFFKRLNQQYPKCRVDRVTEQQAYDIRQLMVATAKLTHARYMEIVDAKPLTESD